MFHAPRISKQQPTQTELDAALTLANQKADEKGLTPTADPRIRVDKEGRTYRLSKQAMPGGKFGAVWKLTRNGGVTRKAAKVQDQSEHVPTEVVDAYRKASLQDKREILKDQWYETAFVLLERAKKMAPNTPKTEFGRLQQAIVAAGIAYDKVTPKADTVAMGNLVAHLFHGLNSSKVSQVIGEAPVPKGRLIEATPEAVAVEASAVHVEPSESV